MSKLHASDWIVTGHEVIAWVNDLEFFDIVFSVKTQTFELRINHLGTATTVYLGDTPTVAQAILAAQKWVMEDGHGGQQTLTCTHGLTLGEICPGCAEDNE